MLTLALVIDDDAPGVQAALTALTGIPRDGRPLLIFDAGASPQNRDAVQHFLRRNGGELIMLGASITHGEAEDLARQRTGADYVLTLGCDDRVHPPGLHQLEECLRLHPKHVLLAIGWWLTSCNRYLTGPDEARLTAMGATIQAEEAARLFPVPRRLLVKGGQRQKSEADDDPAETWSVWTSALKNVDEIHVQPVPPILRRMPSHGPASLMKFIQASFAKAPRAERAARLARLLPWLADECTLAPAEAALSTMTAATALLRAMPRAQRRMLCSMPFAPGALFQSLQNGQKDQAMAHLCMMAAARNDAKTTALAEEYAALRSDLEAALPGPEYLRELHSRLMGLG